MKVDYPGLLKETLPSGNRRYRVRVEGDPRRRIRLHINPEHKDFADHYRAARCGIETKLDSQLENNTIRGSVAWLTVKHLNDLEKRVAAGLASPLTVKKRQLLFKRLRDHCGEYSMDMPPGEIVKIRDAMAHTPAWADSMVEAIRVMYRWAGERGICEINPAAGIGKIDRGKGGAKPWTVEDLRAYRKFHPPGTTAHLCLTVFMFTACRIGDAVVLGRGNEFERGGLRALAWRPRKKGSAFVEIPMLPPLYKATRAVTVLGPTYLLTERGKPFESPDALGQKFRKWCRAARLDHLSSHGVRKAAGHLLAQAGCSQYQIMSIHGHTQAKTSEIYTKGVERWKMAADAMRTLERMEW